MKKATPENTLFITGCNKFIQSMHFTLGSARIHDIFVHVLESDKQSRKYLWDIKFETTLEFLNSSAARNKEYFVFFDAFDVLFTARAKTILDRYNEINPGRLMFNADHVRMMWPYPLGGGKYGYAHSESAWYIDKIQDGCRDRSKLLNSGFLIGRIEDARKVIPLVRENVQRYLSGEWITPITQRLYAECGNPLTVPGSDQFRWTLTYAHYPELITVDSEKALVSVVAGDKWENDLAIDHWRRPTVTMPLQDGRCVGEALVLHFPGSANVGGVASTNGLFVPVVDDHPDPDNPKYKKCRFCEVLPSKPFNGQRPCAGHDTLCSREDLKRPDGSKFRMYEAHCKPGKCALFQGLFDAEPGRVAELKITGCR